MIDLYFLTLLSVYTLVCLLLCLIVIKKSRNLINVVFVLALCIFAIGSAIASLGFVEITSQSTVWPIATSLLILAPIGFFVSSRMILYGEFELTKFHTDIIVYLYSLLAIINFFIYNSLTRNETYLFGDTLIAIILFITSLQYLKLYQIDKEHKVNLLLLISGFGIATVSLIGNDMLILVTGTGEVLRIVGPIIGLLIVVLAFIKLPKIRVANKITGINE